MYDILAERLRNYSENFVAYKLDANFASAVQEAADAIEELVAFKAQITDGHFYCMRDGVLYKAKVEMPKEKTIQLPLVEFADQLKEE